MASSGYSANVMRAKQSVGKRATQNRTTVHNDSGSQIIQNNNSNIIKTIEPTETVNPVDKNFNSNNNSSSSKASVGVISGS
mmetsp:Transcript_21850/g.33855  ORF Transcript_21850/g.33855 Transcript_21850/m.33855 type:complete len:81 (-) Transcript_21850:1427-1669(-)